MPYPTPVWLLDKNVVRVALTALTRLELGQSLSAADLTCLELLRAVRENQVEGRISPELSNILSRFMHLPHVHLALITLPILYPTRYFRRWARRLRVANFSREDAKVVALATFGVDEARARFGADAIITGDVRLIHNFELEFSALDRRLRAMTAQLRMPYRSATLPRIITPEEATQDLAALQPGKRATP